jgi:hypothetical protein
MKSAAWLGVSLAVVLALAGCAIFGRTAKDEDRFVRPDSPRTSPSGSFVASVEDGPRQDGVGTLVVVISDDAGAEVFRDQYAYSTRHGVGVTWLSGHDQLWILSSDVGTAHVDRRDDGTWTKTAITPETKGDIPQEIADLK